MLRAPTSKTGKNARKPNASIFSHTLKDTEMLMYNIPTVVMACYISIYILKLVWNNKDFIYKSGSIA